MSRSDEKCGRCDAAIDASRHWCLHCGAALCDRCGEAFSHCGHPRANEMNRPPAEPHARSERALLVAQMEQVLRTLAAVDRSDRLPPPRTRVPN